MKWHSAKKCRNTFPYFTALRQITSKYRHTKTIYGIPAFFQEVWSCQITRIGDFGVDKNNTDSHVPARVLTNSTNSTYQLPQWTGWILLSSQLSDRERVMESLDLTSVYQASILAHLVQSKLYKNEIDF